MSTDLNLDAIRADLAAAQRWAKWGNGNGTDCMAAQRFIGAGADLLAEVDRLGAVIAALTTDVGNVDDCECGWSTLTLEDGPEEINPACRHHGAAAAVVRAARHIDEPAEDRNDWLIWSNHYQAWWGFNSSGYRNNILQAGRYTRAAAEAECKSRSWPDDNSPPEVAILCPPHLLAQPDAAAMVDNLISAATAAAVEQRKAAAVAA